MGDDVVSEAREIGQLMLASLVAAPVLIALLAIAFIGGRRKSAKDGRNG